MRKLLISFGIFLALPFFIVAQNTIEINSASLTELENIVSVGPSTAQKIIDARPFSSLDDLLRVKGIGEKTLQKIKDQGLAYVVGENNLATENKKEISAAPAGAASEMKTAANSIIFSEIMPAPTGSDEENEWIEIYNPSEQVINLNGFSIEDSSGSSGKYSFKDVTLNSHQYLVLKRPETHIILNNEGDSLFLKDGAGNIIDSVEYPKAKTNQSFAKNNTAWNWTTIPTPGASNITSQNLPKIKKPAKNIAVASLVDSLPKTPEISIQDSEEPKPYNPWLLLTLALAIAGVSGGIILFIKIRFQRKTDTNYHERSFPF